MATEVQPSAGNATVLGEAMPVKTATASVKFRSLAIAAALIPLLIFWVECAECVTRGTDLAATSLMMASAFPTFLI